MIFLTEHHQTSKMQNQLKYVNIANHTVDIKWSEYRPVGTPCNSWHLYVIQLTPLCPR